jgi:hypothetical protein
VEVDMADGSDGFIEVGEYRATVYATEKADGWTAHVSFQRRRELAADPDNAAAFARDVPGIFRNLADAIAGAHAFAVQCEAAGETGR